jgi:hypothetical protein
LQSLPWQFSQVQFSQVHFSPSAHSQFSQLHESPQQQAALVVLVAANELKPKIEAPVTKAPANSLLVKDIEYSCEIVSRCDGN